MLSGVPHILAFSCNDFTGGSFSTEFCVSTACHSYCATHATPEYCMDTHYVQHGYCTQISGFASPECQVVIGVLPEHTHWCRTIGCNYALTACEMAGDEDCSTKIQEWVLKDFASCAPLVEMIELIML